MKQASPEEIQLLQGAVQSVVKTASRRHRRSLDKAVEVLECVADAAAEPLEQWTEEKVDTTVELIQQAMDEAIKRHRRSIAEAVRSCEEAEDSDVSGAALASKMPCAADACVEARIQRAVSAAYSQQNANSKEDVAWNACGPKANDSQCTN